MNILHICPPDLSDVAILPCEIQKSHFQQNTVYSTVNTVYYIIAQVSAPLHGKLTLEYVT